MIDVKKINIYDYINSGAIGKHCEKIMHSFSASESTCIINKSIRHTLGEKHTAFKYIIETMPDEMIKTYTESGMDKVSLHKTLKDLINIQNRMFKDFKTEDDNFIYTCSVYCNRKYDPQKYGPYRTLKDLFDDIDDLEKLIIEYDVTKIRLSDRKCMSAVFNSEKNPITVTSCLLNAQEEYIAERFDLMWFVCPTPFKKGDIVYAPNMTRTYPPYTIAEPFVLDEICYENTDSEYISKRYDNGDITDMTATGYFQNEDGSIYAECMHDYMSLEYYDGKLDGKLRILKALSMYIKGEIWIDLLLNAYDVIMQEGELKKAKDGLYYLDDLLNKIGISKEHGF